MKEEEWALWERVFREWQHIGPCLTSAHVSRHILGLARRFLLQWKVAGGHWQRGQRDKSDTKSHKKGKNPEKKMAYNKKTVKRNIFTNWGQVWQSSRHHHPPWCLFVHPSSSPGGTQRVKVYSGLGLQLYCLEPLGSWVHMPFLAGLWTPWRASPAPDPHSAEGALQRGTAKKYTTFIHAAPYSRDKASPIFKPSLPGFIRFKCRPEDGHDLDAQLSEATTNS